MSMLKKFLKWFLKKKGYEICPINQKLLPSTPQWIQESSALPNVDAVIKGGWDYNVLHMANKNYSPPHPGFLRTRYGEDYRIKYVTYTLDLRDQRILELGPHEGHWSVLIEKMGARENVAVEAREKNYVKCMRIKEKYGLSRTTFYQGNIEDLYNLKIEPPFVGRFDLIFCLGLFYHLPNPPKALEWFLRYSDTLFLGTHYVEPRAIQLYKTAWPDEVLVHQGESYKGKWYLEGGLQDTLSGLSNRSFWPYEKDLIQMLKHSGYSKIDVLGKDGVNGMPHITLLAKR